MESAIERRGRKGLATPMQVRPQRDHEGEESARRKVSCGDLGEPVKVGDEIRLTSWSTIK